MAYTEDDLQQVNEALAKLVAGERVVQVAHDGHVVKYKDIELSDLVVLRDRINAQVQGRKAGKKRRIQNSRRRDLGAGAVGNRCPRARPQP